MKFLNMLKMLKGSKEKIIPKNFDPDKYMRSCSNGEFMEKFVAAYYAIEEEANRRNLLIIKKK